MGPKGVGWGGVERGELGGALLLEEESTSQGMQVPLEAGRDEDKGPALEPPEEPALPAS